MRQIFLFAALATSLALLSGCTLSKTKADTAEDMTGKAAYQKISAEDAYEMMVSQEVVVVDVRTREEYDGGHIENAVLVPNESIGSEMPETLPDKEATLLIYCRSGRRSKDAAQKLLALGYQSVYDFGGVIDWPYELVKEG
ncbi:MAG: rhodanese-like domain-containing protein [Firmicutes bacterium]|jgi:rhodanese-related sulfurtransferase|nr:rhodanese-like domain-containing protein [Bacillota bacterium]